MAANGVSGAHGSDRTGPGGPGPVRVDLGEVGFGDVLRAVNPLQYLPVVGTIYRIATGDAAPAGLRTGVSAVVGLLTGGPIGLLGSIAGSLAEQFFHAEARLRQALVSTPAPTATVPAGDAQISRTETSRTETSRTEASPSEGDLGRRSSDRPSPGATSPPPAGVAAAYRSAGLLGAV